MNSRNRNIILGIIVVIIVAGGIYYYKNKNTPSPILNTVGNTTGVETNTNTENTTLPTKDSAAAAELSIDQQRFSNSILAARNAFVKKDYKIAITLYNQALKYTTDHKDIGYVGLFEVYSAQNKWTDARTYIDKAIAANPFYVDYWNWKLALLAEHTSFTFDDLKAVYNDGLTKANLKTKINLVTYFARIAENKGQTGEAIKLWQYAKQLYPTNNAIYQAEIDRLNSLQ